MEKFLLKSVLLVRKSLKLTNVYIFDLEMNISWKTCSGILLPIAIKTLKLH